MGPARFSATPGTSPPKHWAPLEVHWFDAAQLGAGIEQDGLSWRPQNPEETLVATFAEETNG